MVAALMARTIMDRLAKRSLEIYRDLVYHHPRFKEYFYLATPIAEISNHSLGSRPARIVCTPRRESAVVYPGRYPNG